MGEVELSEALAVNARELRDSSLWDESDPATVLRLRALHLQAAELLSAIYRELDVAAKRSLSGS